MSFKTSLSLAVVAAFAASLTATADPTGDPIVVPAPCSNTEQPVTSGPSAGLRTCKAFINGDVSQSGTGLLTNLKSLLQIHVHNTLKAPSTTGIKMCVLAPNTLATKDGQPFSEEFVDANGVSCGTAMTVTVQTRPTVVQFHKNPPAQGTLEDGWIAGAQFQAVAYYMADVTNEIQSQRQFTVRAYSHGPSYAASMAKDYLNLLKQRNNLFAIVASRANSQEILSETMKCVQAGSSSPATAQSPAAVQRSNAIFTTANTGPSPASTSPTGVGQQVAQLCTTQVSLEMAYLNLAATEVMGHGQDAHYTEMGSDTGYLKTIQWLMDTMKVACSSAGTSGASQCYHDNVGSKLRERIQNTWPVNTQGQITGRAKAGNTLGVPFFVLAGLGGRRRRRSSRRRSLRRPLLTLLIIACGAVLAACDGGGSGSSGITASTPTQIIQPPANLQCPYGMAQYKVECCNPDGSLNTTLCSDPNTLLDGGITAGLSQGGANLTNGNAALSNAAALFGIPRNVLGVNPNASTANLTSTLAGGANANNGTQTPTDTPALVNNAATAGDSTPPSGGGTPSLDTSSGGALPTGGTPGAPGASAGALASGAATPGGGGGNYKGTGKQDGGDAAAIDPASFFAGAGEAGGKDPTNTEFAKKSDPTKPMGTADPEDYFTRISLEDSIFKIVTRRYRAKAFSWAMNNSESTFKEASQAISKK